MDADLTLEKAKRLVRQREAVQGQQAILNKHDGGIPIESLGMRKPHKRSVNKQTWRLPSVRQQQIQPLKCSYCGKWSHRSKIALQERQPVTSVVKRVTTAQCAAVKPWQQFQKSSQLILLTWIQFMTQEKLYGQLPLK